MYDNSDKKSDGAKPSVLDWAVLALLERVRTDLLLPKQNKWAQAILENTGDDQYLPERISAAFCFAETRTVGLQFSSHEQSALNHLSSRRTTEDLGVLAKLVVEKGHLLFNSYYYIRKELFGEKVFLPVIPGYFSEGKDDGAEWAIDYAARAKLPLAINPKYLDTLLSFWLPERAGVTSQYSRLHSERRYGDAVYSLPYFLADFGVLNKWDDYVNGHLSALIAPVLRQSDRECLGAFVLTSNLPSAFDTDDKNTLESIINSIWVTSPLEMIHAGTTRKIRGIVVDTKVENQDELGGSGTTKTLQLAGQNALVQLASKDYLAILGSKDVRLGLNLPVLALNFEAIYRGLIGMFGATPSFRLASINSEDGESDFINPELFEELCTNLKSAFDPTTNQESKLAAVKTLLFSGSLPLGLLQLFGFVQANGDLAEGLTDCLRSIRIHRTKPSAILAILRAPIGTPEPIIIPREQLKVLALLRRCINTALSIPQPLGSTNPVLANVQQMWNDKCFSDHEELDLHLGTTPATRYAVFSLSTEETLANPVGTSHLIVSLLRRLMLLDPGITAIEILDREDVFLPGRSLDLPTNKICSTDEAIEACCLSFACFWVFQHIHRLLNLMDWPLNAFDQKGVPKPPNEWLSFRPLKSIFGNEGLPTVRLNKGTNPAKNAQWISTLTYLGIPLDAPTENQAASSELVANVDTDRIKEVIHAYLNALLKRANQVQCLHRAFASLPNSLRVDSIVIEGLTPHCSTFHSIFSISGAANKSATHDVRLNWRRIPSVVPLLCAINAEQIQKRVWITANHQLEQTPPEASTQVLCLTLAKPWRRSTASSPEKVVIENLKGTLDEIFKSITAIQSVGAREILHTVTHETRGALGPIQTLLDRVASSPFLTGSLASTLERLTHRSSFTRTPLRTLHERATIARRAIQLGLSIHDLEKSVQTDLLRNSGDISAEDAIRRIVRISTDLGIARAQRRARVGRTLVELEDGWFQVIQKLVTQNLRFRDLTPSSIKFWGIDSQPHLKKRLGLQCILITALSNTVQHLVLGYVEDEGRSAPHRFNGEKVMLDVQDAPFFMEGPEPAIVLEFTPTALSIYNRTHPKPGAPPRLRSRGTEAILAACLDRNNFGYDATGKVTQFEPLEEQPNYWITQVFLPQPFYGIPIT